MPNLCNQAVYLHLDNIHQGIYKQAFLKDIWYKTYEYITNSNTGYLYMNYYLHIFFPLMHVLH
jgi:hypothetical protein